MDGGCGGSGSAGVPHEVDPPAGAVPAGDMGASMDGGRWASCSEGVPHDVVPPAGSEPAGDMGGVMVGVCCDSGSEGAPQGVDPLAVAVPAGDPNASLDGVGSGSAEARALAKVIVTYKASCPCKLRRRGRLRCCKRPLAAGALGAGARCHYCDASLDGVVAAYCPA